MTKRNAKLPEEQLEEEEIYEGDAAPAATSEQIAKVTDLAREQLRMKLRKQQLDKELEALNEKLDLNREKLLPDAMLAAGLETMGLTGGYTIDVDKFVKASVPSDDAKRTKDPDAPLKNKAGIEYMEGRAPDLVQHQLTAKFPKGQEKLFHKFMRDMGQRKIQIEYDIKHTVNAATLTSWLKKEEKAGRSVDETKINVHRFTVAEVNPPKEK